LRVISGKLKGKKLSATKGLSLRPTSDRVKEAIFDILQDQVQGQKVLDLFAGTGALGIEAISRGAQKAIFIEKNPPSLKALRKNIEDCHLGQQVEILAREAREGIKILEGRRESFALVFLDPPYGKGLAEKTLASLSQSSIVAPEALIITEHATTEEIRPTPPLQVIDERKYGRTKISIFQLVAK